MLHCTENPDLPSGIDLFDVLADHAVLYYPEDLRIETEIYCIWFL